jgi:prevent-host-death family protein
MKPLSVAETKRRFSELIDRVLQGERFLVARRGKPAVALVPPSECAPSPERAPGGLLSLVGALSDIEDFDVVMRDVVASRRKAKDRPAPDLS